MLSPKDSPLAGTFVDPTTGFPTPGHPNGGTPTAKESLNLPPPPPPRKATTLLREGNDKIFIIKFSGTYNVVDTRSCAHTCINIKLDL